MTPGDLIRVLLAAALILVGLVIGFSIEPDPYGYMP